MFYNQFKVDADDQSVFNVGVIMITLYRFPYSCYALKVQFLLDHLQLPYETKDVPFSDRDELIEVIGGRVTVPALVHDGNVVVESRDIFQYLLTLTKND